MGIKVANNAFGTLAAGIASGATSITLTTGHGARFPTLNQFDYFYATLIDTSNNLEIVKCTARQNDVLTVTRAQEGTTARAYSAGDRIEIRLTAQTFADAVSDASNLTSGTVPTARLGTGTANSATFLRGDRRWAVVEGVPAGSLIYYAGSVAPAGYLEANGALLSRTTYAALFAAIGIIYNAGDGSTTFGLPDLRGEFIRGWDHGRGFDAGRVFGAFQDHSMQWHNHYLPTSTGGGNSHFTIPDGAWVISTPNEYAVTGLAPAVTISANNNPNAASGSSGNFSVETRPRNVAALICIKY